MRKLEVGSFCDSKGSGLEGGVRKTLAEIYRGQKGWAGPLGVFEGDGVGLGRSQVTRRELVIKTLELYGSVLK